MISRNDPFGFALRTRKNLNCILEAHARSEDVHPVTQVTCSLMGIVVFPWERKHRLEKSKTPLSEIFHDPKLEFDVLKGKGEVETLGEFWCLIRNAACHGRVKFSSDSKELKEVKITFTSGDKEGEEFEIKWQISMRGDQLLLFCQGLICYISKNPKNDPSES